MCATAFGFTSDWMKKWRDFFTNRSEVAGLCQAHLKSNKHTCLRRLFCSSLSDSAKARAKARSSSSCVVCGGLGGFSFD